MEEQKFKVIIVEDVKLELKGTEEIFRHEIPNAEVIGTAMTENEFWPLMEAQLPGTARSWFGWFYHYWSRYLPQYIQTLQRSSGFDIYG